MGERRRPQSVEIIEILQDTPDAGRFTRSESPAYSAFSASSASSRSPASSAPKQPRVRPATVALLSVAGLILAAVAVRSLVSTSPHAASNRPTATVPERIAIAPGPLPVSIPLPQDTAVPVVTVPTGGVCSDDRMPFHATFLPDGWTTDGSVWTGPDLLGAGSPTVRALHGGEIPLQGPAIRAVTVLGGPASLAAVFEGYSVNFVLGSPSDPCDHWALVASSGVPAATLERIAEGMSPFGGGTQSLSCEQTARASDSLLEDQHVVLDAVAFPTHALSVIADHLPGGVAALFARQLLFVRPNVALTISLAAASRNTAGIGWQSGAVPVSRVEMSNCLSGGDWLASIGGIWVLEPQCVALEIEANGVGTQVEVGVGVECP
jgi:hypothetical protein